MTTTFGNPPTQTASVKNTFFAYREVGLQGDTTVIFMQQAREVTHGG